MLRCVFIFISCCEEMLDGRREEVEEKDEEVSLTDEGIKKAEAYFHVENYGDPENMEISHHVQQALKANTLMKRDIDYIVKEGEIIIVDEFTGRLMFGRRFSMIKLDMIFSRDAIARYLNEPNKYEAQYGA